MTEDEPADNPAPLVLRALALGVLFGISLQGLVTWGVRSLQANHPQSGPPALDSPGALLLLGGTLGSILAAAGASWLALRALGNPWRQAMLAMIAGISSFVISLATIPIEQAAGRQGLLGVSLLGALGFVWLGRRSVRAGRAA